ncbi:hypothetical protein PMIN06_007467 [Paraphaeosphaeria minitans]
MYQLLLAGMAALPSVYGIAFPAPSPTVANPAEKVFIGWTPQTTPKPRHAPAIKFDKRQTDYISRDPGLCGWVEFGASSLACPGTGLTCALYTSGTGGMAGCCDSSDTQNCNWVNSCVNYDAWTKKSCDAACQRNTFVRKCTSAASPYCVTWTYPSDGVADYGCADYNSGVVTVEQSSTDFVDESSYWITLPTLSGDAVTGWDGEASTVESPLFSTSEDLSSSDPDATNTPSGNGNGSTPEPQTPKKKTSVGLIAGAAVGGLVVLFLIGAAIIFVCVKRRKAKQLANNQTIIAAQQSYQQPPHQPQTHQEYKPSLPVPAQAPPPLAQQQQGYFPPQEQKVNYQTHVTVQEQGLQSPVISNPPTPAPPYVQPYYAAPSAGMPPLPEGRYEVDGITATPGRPGASEMGPGK